MPIPSSPALPQSAMLNVSCVPGLTIRSRSCRHPRKRQPARSAPPGTHPPPPVVSPIVWPADLTGHNPARRRIEIGCSAPADVPLFFSLPFDIRHIIYSLILQDAGTRHHIFCPAVSRRKMPSELQSRRLLSKKRTDGNCQPTCGHYECEDATYRRNPDAGGHASSGSRLADLTSLMRTSKFAYQEVAHFLYSSTTFSFASFAELGAFLDWINPENIASIRSINLIAHMVPDSAEYCTQLMRGNYFRGDGWDHVALLKRMPGLTTLEIDFFPSAMLSFTTRFNEIMKPLEELSAETDIRVRLPRIFYNKDKRGQGLPILQHVEDRPAFYTLRRPEAVGGNQLGRCKAYCVLF